MKPLLLLVAGWVAAIAVVVALVVDGRNTALERGHRSAAGFAQIVEEHTVRTFQAVAITVATVADAWELSRPPKHDPEFQELLRQRLQDLPYVRAIFVVGADGFLIHNTGERARPELNLADREYFKPYLGNPSLQRAVSPLLDARTGAGWFVAVTERLGPPGHFEGVVGAAVQPGYFETLYRKMQLGEDDAIALLHRDGTLIARYPAAPDAVGKSFGHLPLFRTHLPRAASGTYATDEGMFSTGRIVGYRAVEGLPLVVRVSRSEDSLLGPWRRSAIGAAVAMAALTLLLTGVLVRELRRRHRREEARAQRAQAEKLEAMGQLTGGIAHDFNNLLSIISMNVDLILRRPADADNAQRAAAAAQRAVERGAELIRRLLAFARRQPLELKPAMLNSLLTEAHPLVAQAAGPRIELVLQLAPDLPPVLVDETQFEVALLNLVVNARDAMSGRGRIVLRTYAAPQGGGACLAVEDEGPGMSEQIRRRALEPFFSTKGEGGTGLGLAQVYGFMQQIGGSIQIDSAPGQGTRVHLRFPRAPALTGVKAGS